MKPKTQPNRIEIDTKFKLALRKLQKSAEAYDQKIEEALAQAIAYKKAGRLDEEQRIMAKIQRYLAAKIEKEKYIDKVEMIMERIDDIFDKIETSRTLRDAYAGVNELVDSRELKSIIRELEAFDKTFQKTNNLVDAFMGGMDEAMDHMNVDPTYAASIQSMINERMKGYEERVDGAVEEELSAESMFTLN